MARLGSLLAFLVFYPTLIYAADLKVESKLSDAHLEIGDQLTFTITIISDSQLTKPGPRFQPPEITGLDYMGVSESSSTGISINNFKRTSTYKVSMNISYACVKEGEYEVPAVDLDLPGDLKTSVLKFRVHKKLPANLKKKQSSVAGRRRSRMNSLLDQFMGFGGGGSTAFSDGSDEFNPEFFVEVEIDKSEVFEGEQLVASWYVYISDRTSLSSFDTLQFPTLRGFWKEDVNFASRFFWKPVVKDGKRYMRSILSSYALTPYNAGKLEIDSFELRVVASQQSFFNQKRKVIKASSKPVLIKVKPLPQPVPESFFGGVGRFKIDMGNHLEKKEVLYGEPFVHKIRIIGDRATTKFIKPPKFDLGKDFKVYSVDEDYKFIAPKVSSYKDLKYSLVPRKEGLYTIPDTKVSFLDPDTGAYYDLYLKVPPLKVLPNKNAQRVSDADFWDEDEGAEQIEKKRLKPAVQNKILDLFYVKIPLHIQFFGLLICLCVCFFMYRKISIVKRVQTTLLDQLEKRAHRAAKIFKDGDRKEALEELINVYSLLIGGVSGKRFGLEEEFSKAVQNLPPSLKPSQQILENLNTDLQDLRFGAALDSKENQVKLQECLSQFNTLFADLRKYLR